MLATPGQQPQRSMNRAYLIRVFGRVEALEEEVRTIKADSAGRDQRQDRKHKERPIEELHRAKRVEATVQKTKDAKRHKVSPYSTVPVHLYSMYI